MLSSLPAIEESTICESGVEGVRVQLEGKSKLQETAGYGYGASFSVFRTKRA